MARARSSLEPERVHVRMYQVGFGDCFLLSFHYRAPLPDARAERHMLIDFGSTHSPRTGPRKLLARVAEDIDRRTSGQIDVVVATHRHRDHLSGFAAEETAALIDKLAPTLVLRPWTDDPKLPADARAPRFRARSHRFAAGLVAGQDFAELVLNRIGEPHARSLGGELAALADDQLPNREAIETLKRWSKGGRGQYLAAGRRSRVEEVVPGVRLRVLGPPTIKEWPEVARQRANDPEYWLAQQRHLRGAPPRMLTDELAATVRVESGVGQTRTVEPGPVAWLVDHLRRQHLASLLRIVRTVDDALNNTSLILLIDAGDKRMLFPGDAQIENWSWVLHNARSSASLRRLLARVDLYKVGHHGSRNATPRSLFRLWGEDPDPERPMVALMSTLSGAHGRSEATRVPRRTLVEALNRRMTLLTTDALPAAQPFVEVAAKTRGGGPFTRLDDGIRPGGGG